MEAALLVLFGLFVYAVEGVLWGTMGYVLLRAYCGDDRKHVLGLFIAGAAYIVVEVVIVNTFIQGSTLEVTAASQSAQSLLSSSLGAIDLGEVISSLVAVTAGYYFCGRPLIIRVLRRVAA
jgi:hypothetical protein